MVVWDVDGDWEKGLSKSARTGKVRKGRRRADNVNDDLWVNQRKEEAGSLVLPKLTNMKLTWKRNMSNPLVGMNIKLYFYLYFCSFHYFYCNDYGFNDIDFGKS